MQAPACRLPGCQLARSSAERTHLLCLPGTTLQAVRADVFAFVLLQQQWDKLAPAECEGKVRQACLGGGPTVHGGGRTVHGAVTDMRC